MESFTELVIHSVSAHFLALGVPFIPVLAFLAWEYSNGKAKEIDLRRGCKRIGRAANQELDLYKEQRVIQEAQVEAEKGQYSIKALVIYPIKSCFPVMVDHGDVVSTGMKYDRQFSFAELVPISKADREKPKFPKNYPDKCHWKSITQREYPLLTKVKIELWVPDEGCPSYSAKDPNIANGGFLIVTFPDPTNARHSLSFQVPFEPCEARIKRMKYPEQSVQIWVDFPRAINMTSEIPPETLTKLKELLSLQKPGNLSQLALFRIDSSRGNEQLREVYRCAPKREDIGYQPVVGFADAYPLHLINTASVHNLSTRIDSEASPLDPLRFRANLYVEGPKAFAEDTWKLIRIGAAKYHVSSRTARCNLPNVDPQTGIRDRNEPRRVMDNHRKVDKGCPKDPCLGMQVTPMQRHGEINVGDKIEVLETGEHFYLNWPEYT